MRSIVIKTVFTPLCCVVQGACYKRGEVVEVILGLSEHTRLGNETIVVALHNVAHGEFLIDEGVGARTGEVFGLHVLAIAVNVVSAVVKVGDFVGVCAHIVTQVHTSVEIEAIIDLFRVGRHEPQPLVEVFAHAHYHFRAAFARSVHLLNFAVGESAVGIAELCGENAVVRAVPCGAVLLRDALSALTATEAEREISHGVQRRGAVDLPEVLELELGLVVNILLRVAHLSVTVVTEGGVVAILLAGTHIFTHFLPTLHGESVVSGTLVVHLRRSEGGEGEQMVLAQLLRNRQEVIPCTEIAALDIAVAPSFAAHDGQSPAVGGATRGERESEFVVSVITQAVGESTSLAGVGSLGDDVDRSAD